ncbi:hypothetical protein BGX33_007161 [Mortierella sp. NVP41]|nr:hypothetical protein BGX33_007161 [Mortierella sp. NVP41]
MPTSARFTSTVSPGSSTIGSDLAGGGGTSGLGGGAAGLMVADSTGSGASGQIDTDAASPGSFPPSFVGMIQKLLEEQPAQIFLDSNGALTITRAQSEGVVRLSPYRPDHYSILSSRLSKETATIHADGPRSVEKEHAHQKRDSALERQLVNFEKDYADGKIKGTKNLCRRIKAVYRAPPEALRHVLNVLEEKGWRVCHCNHQADRCIARHVKDATELENVRVITKDSDSVVYEVSTSITLPVGNQWKIFQKQDLMDQHQLPTPAHLLLLGILTTNDYTDGVPFYGLVSSADIVRTFELEALEELNDQERLQRFKHHITHYSNIVHDNATKVMGTAVRSRTRRRERNPNAAQAPKADEKDVRGSRGLSAS